MTETVSTTVVNETLASGLRYSEDVGFQVRSHAVRYCYLWLDGEESPVSELEVHSILQRFGAVAVPAEGIGGAETPAPFRRRGYMRQLLERATAGMAQRVDVAFVSDAIEGLYEKAGYHTCLAEGTLALKIQNVERFMQGADAHGKQGTVRDLAPDDLPALIDLYNANHAQRPWTLVRSAQWNRLVQVQTWKPGSTGFVLVEDGQVVGYAIYKEHFYGWSSHGWVIDEMAARDEGAATGLLVELARRCWQLRINEFEVCEPLDSIVGSVARRLGCDYRQSYPVTGGMMGAILHRAPLLAALEPELRRRLHGSQFAADHAHTFPLLQSGELIADNKILLRLLLGDWSLQDAQAEKVNIPQHLIGLCGAWFPGGGNQLLSQPYAHKLDRY